MDETMPTQPETARISALSWTEEELDKFCWDAGVLTKVTVYGFPKAATDAFLERGYRLATIIQDIVPFHFIHKLSLYMIGDQPPLGRREAKKLARTVMEEIGIHPKPDECMAEMSGRRLVVSVGLPHWAWIRHWEFDGSDAEFD